jgi:hypothetical protein
MPQTKDIKYRTSSKKLRNLPINIAMTIADHIRAEEREVTTFNYIKGLLEEGLDVNLISKAFKIPVKKVETIIQKIKESSN